MVVDSRDRWKRSGATPALRRCVSDSRLPAASCILIRRADRGTRVKAWVGMDTEAA